MPLAQETTFLGQNTKFEPIDLPAGAGASLALGHIIGIPMLGLVFGLAGGVVVLNWKQWYDQVILSTSPIARPLV